TLTLPHPRLSLSPYTTLFRSHASSEPCESTKMPPTTLSIRSEKNLGASSRESKVQGNVNECSRAWQISSRSSSYRLKVTCCASRSEEHTSELQSQSKLVCRLL